MKRRVLLAAVLAAPAAPAFAGASSGPAEAEVLNMAAVGLPVIAGGRVRNYVFVQIRLHLARGQRADAVRPKEPFFRDALVRAAHRRPFTLASDWNSLNAAAMTGVLVRAATGIAGANVVTRADVVTQSPRRRVSPTAAR